MIIGGKVWWSWGRGGKENWQTVAPGGQDKEHIRCSLSLFKTTA